MPSSVCLSPPTAFLKASISRALFDTVIHYDLSWNPTRHQQREGRVDRFGQPAKLVRSVLLYSPDSAIDGAVLEVILRKAEAIRKATGVTVPLPEERGAVTGALMNAVLLRKRSSTGSWPSILGSRRRSLMETRWRDAEEGETPLACSFRPERHQAGRGRARNGSVGANFSAARRKFSASSSAQ